MSGFAVAPLEDLVSARWTDSESVVLWVRSRFPGQHRLQIWAESAPDARQSLRFDIGGDPHADNTAILHWPGDFEGASALSPATRYGFRVLREADAALIGTGRFETAPSDAASAPDDFAIAILSCHQPFDDQGRLREVSLRGLRPLVAAFEQHNVKRVLWLGDQVYADYPRPLSLYEPSHFAAVAPAGRANIFECDRSEVRALFQARYRAFWSVDAFQDILRGWSCSFMLDDHEIVDNFGSTPAHASPEWQSVREGALDAFDDYQATGRAPRGRGTEISRHFSFSYGPLAVFVMDLRSQKHARGEAIHIFSRAQADELCAFLDANRQREVLALGLSVPLVHIPDWMAALGAMVGGEATDTHDRWSHPYASASRDAIVKILLEHQQRRPEQRIVLLSGDIHTGLASKLSWRGFERGIVQFVSSAASNLENRWFRSMAEQLPRLAKQVEVGEGDIRCGVHLLEGQGENPFAGLNAGLLLFQRRNGRYRVRVRLLSHGLDDAAHPRVVFTSGEL